MARILLLGCGPLPVDDGAQHGGPGIRTWQLARPLRDAGHVLRLVTIGDQGGIEARVTSEVAAGCERVVLDQDAASTEVTLRGEIRAFRPDALVAATAFPSFLLARLRPAQPLWADLFGDPMAEAQAQAAVTGSDWAIENNRYMLLPILAHADAFSVVSARQRDALLGQLALVGRLTSYTDLDELVHVVPCAWCEEMGAAPSRERSAGAPVVALSSGGFNTWCDVDTLQTAVDLALTEEPHLRFVATGGAIPGFDEQTFARARAWASRAPAGERIELTGWIERDELRRREEAADFGVVAEKALLERRLGSANRCLQWMGQGLPFVCARLSELAVELERDGLALTYPPGDARALADAMLRLAREPELRHTLASRVAHAARTRYSFTATTVPLVAWASAPRLALGRGRTRPWSSPQETARRVVERDALRARLAAIHGSGTWRLWVAALAWRRRLRRLPGALRRRVRDFDAARAVTSLRALPVWSYLAIVCLTKLARAGRRGLLAKIGLGPRAPAGTAPPQPIALGRRPRILVVAPAPLIPAYQGGSTRIVRLLEQLGEGADVYVFTYDHTSRDPAQEQALAPFCRKVFVHRRESVGPARPWDLEPRSVQYYASQIVRERLADIVRQEHIDIVQLEAMELGQFMDAFGDAKVVLSALDLAFVTSHRRRSAGFHRRYAVDRQLQSSPVAWMRTLRHELAVCERVRQVHVMSERDGEILARFLSDGWRRLRVVPNGVAVPNDLPRGVEGRRGVLFVGYFGHTPNLDAALHLLGDIWPLVRARRQDAELTIVGADVPASITAFDGRDGIRVVGTVPSTAPFYASHRLLAAPLRAGSGTRLKILEAFAAGLPVVTTALGAEGLVVTEGEHLLLAESPAAHAEAIHRLLADDALHGRLAVAARALAADRYSWPRVADRARAAYAELLTGDGARATGARASLPPPAPATASDEAVDVSVVVLAGRSWGRLAACLEAIATQRTTRAVEILAVDDGTDERVAAVLARFDVRRLPVDPRTGEGGRRDHAARRARGRVLVLVGGDVVPADDFWLDALTDALLRPGPHAAVQGGIAPDPAVPSRARGRAGWSIESWRAAARWRAALRGPEVSVVNLAVRREVWERLPFGWSPGVEDGKWQRQVERAGLSIATCPQAGVYVTPDRGHGWGSRRVHELQAES